MRRICKEAAAAARSSATPRGGPRPLLSESNFIYWELYWTGDIWNVAAYKFDYLLLSPRCSVGSVRDEFMKRRFRSGEEIHPRSNYYLKVLYRWVRTHDSVVVPERCWSLSSAAARAQLPSTVLPRTTTTTTALPHLVSFYISCYCINYILELQWSTNILS